MRCVGNKCPYYKEHEFKDEYYYCGFGSIGRRKDKIKNFKCNIEEEYNDLKTELERMMVAVEIISINNK